ncbi:hypothetical protein BH20ACI1_BH20ACI1_16140 [soil metagenome]
MNKTKNLFLITFVCLLGLTNISAQTETPRPQPQVEPSYDVILNVITASNNANGKTDVPQTLLNSVKKMKNYFSFKNYNLDSTYLQRTSGNIQVKSVLNTASQNQENYLPIFSDWSLLGLKSFPSNQVQFQSFNFGQRIPIRTSSGVFNYEQVGITLQKFSLPEDTPTVVGSLSGSKADELIFLVLTVKPTE